jgi:hypothetical protein
VGPPIEVARGAGELHRLLDERTFDLRGLELDGFRVWLQRHLEHWRRDPVFAQRSHRRDLRHAHPRLLALEKEHDHIERDEVLTPQSARLREIDRELNDAGRAIAGLTEALGRFPPEKRPGLLQKRNAFQQRQRGLEEERTALIQASPQRQALLRVSTELQQLRAEMGLDQEEARLAQLLRQQGQRAGQSGARFEHLAVELTRTHFLPDLDAGEGRIEMLRGVTLGAAGVEFDQLLVRQPVSSGPVEVLAAVEVKRNINDLAHGFGRRQKDLAWLTGGQYDPTLYRTRTFPSGHFDRTVIHQQEGVSYVVAPSSFRQFHAEPDTGLFLDGLCFITREGALWGISSRALARIRSRVAGDDRWEPDDDDYLSKLLRWCRSRAGSIETPDVLRLYTATKERGRQMLVVRRDG